MAKVYVVNHSGYSYSTVEKYGEPVFMTRGYVYYDKLDSILKKMCELIDSAAEDDYICISGNNFLCAIALQRWTKAHPISMILHWNPDKKSYEQYNLNLG